MLRHSNMKRLDFLETYSKPLFDAGLEEIMGCILKSSHFVSCIFQPFEYNAATLYFPVLFFIIIIKLSFKIEIKLLWISKYRYNFETRREKLKRKKEFVNFQNGILQIAFHQGCSLWRLLWFCFMLATVFKLEALFDWNG